MAATAYRPERCDGRSHTCVPLLDRCAARRRNCRAPGVAVVKIFPGCWHARPRQLKVLPCRNHPKHSRGRMLVPGCRMPWRVPAQKIEISAVPAGQCCRSKLQRAIQTVETKPLALFRRRCQPKKRESGSLTGSCSAQPDPRSSRSDSTVAIGGRLDLQRPRRSCSTRPPRFLYARRQAATARGAASSGSLSARGLRCRGHLLRAAGRVLAKVGRDVRVLAHRLTITGMQSAIEGQRIPEPASADPDRACRIRRHAACRQIPREEARERAIATETP